MERCECCGEPTDDVHRNLRFRLPEAVLRTPGQERAPGSWMTNPDPMRAVLMAVPAIGSFIRALLPVRLTKGHQVTYGVWVEIDGFDFRTACDAWFTPDYARLRLHGTLANVIEPWSVLGAPVTIAVGDPDHLPMCVASENTSLEGALVMTWDDDLITSTMRPES